MYDVGTKSTSVKNGSSDVETSATASLASRVPRPRLHLQSRDCQMFPVRVTGFLAELFVRQIMSSVNRKYGRRLFSRQYYIIINGLSG